ncbi:acyltransferase domain-containing protein [Tistrella bauzanensis]
MLLPVSARGAEALSGAATALADALATPALAARPLTAIAAWAGARRSQHDHRLAVIASDHGEAAERLRDAAAGTAGPGIIAGRGRAANRPGDPVFVFSGMGPQWWAMGRQLIAGEPLFRATIEACDAHLKAAGALVADGRDAAPGSAEPDGRDLYLATVEFRAAGGAGPAVAALGDQAIGDRRSFDR